MSSTSWDKERVLVTGATGVIGREIIQLLSEKNATILAVDRVAFNQKPAMVSFCQLDLSRNDLAQLRDFRPSVVFHLAASFERTLESRGFWVDNYEDNVAASHRLLEAIASLSSLRRFVFASSYLVYDEAVYVSSVPSRPPVRLREDSPIRPRNLCGAAKLFTEREIDFVSGIEVIESTISARIFRVYGRGSRDIISRWVRAAIHGQPLTVWGEENNFDFIYAGDVAEALVRLAESDDPPSVVNVGSGRSRTISDVVSILGRHFPLRTVKESFEGPFESSEADISLLCSATGWVPPTSLEEGISRIVKYELARVGVS